MVRSNDQPTSQRLLEVAPQMRIVAEARRRRARKVALTALLIVVLLAVAAAGTIWVDYSSAQRSFVSRTAGDEALRSALTSTTAGAGNGDTLVVLRSPSASQTAPTAVLLHVSKQDGSARVLVVPPEATLGPPGSGAGTVGEILAVDGRAGLVLEVARRSGQPVGSYLEVEPASLAASLEASASAGKASPADLFLSSLRAAGAASGVWDIWRARLRLARALAPRAAGTMSLGELMELAGILRAAEPDTQVASVPTVAAGGVRVVEAAALRTLAAQMHEGKTLEVTQAQQVESVEPSSVSVTVWNGAGISGIAADAAERLVRAGYRVTVVTNANQFVYDTTLVVYGSGREAAAQRAALDLRAGRVVPRRGMYLFDTDLLVVVGKDWPAVR